MAGPRHDTMPRVTDAVSFHDTPVGRLRLVARGGAVVACEFDGAGEDEGASPVLDRLRRELDAYFAGTLTRFAVPLAPAGTPFERAAWAYLAAIPFGATRSYGAQAAALGRPNAARATGRANGRNPVAVVVPCHRVVGADGRLVGYGGGVERKRWLIEHERAARLAAEAVGEEQGEEVELGVRIGLEGAKVGDGALGVGNDRQNLTARERARRVVVRQVAPHLQLTKLGRHELDRDRHGAGKDPVQRFGQLA